MTMTLNFADEIYRCPTNKGIVAQEKTPKALSLASNQKDSFSAKTRKTEEPPEDVKTVTAEKSSLLPTIIAGVLGLSGLAVGIYGLVENNRLKDLLTKSELDEKRIKAIEEKALKTLKTVEENLISSNEFNDIFNSVFSEVTGEGSSIVLSPESEALLQRSRQIHKRTTESLQRLQETTQRLINDPPVY